MGKLDGQVALISGGSRGQGEVQGRLFAQEGASVVLADVLDAEGELVAASINDTGGDAVYHHLDVTEQNQWASVVDAVVEQYGRLDILINNAGIARLKLIEDSSLQEYLEVIQINQVGVWLGMQAAIPARRRPAAAASSTPPRRRGWKATRGSALTSPRSSPCAG